MLRLVPFVLNEFRVRNKAYRQMKEQVYVYIRMGKWLDVTFLQLTSHHTAGSNALTWGEAGFDLKGTEFTIFAKVHVN